ncbi:MAG: OprD family porin [Epsilonproteobacteria bacterium]|nr:OprD family porin [Campylobacterota bacterium]
MRKDRSVIWLLCLGMLIHAWADEGPKRTLLANRTLVYNVAPKETDTLKAWLREGVFYGRVRLNTFKWDWKEESALTRDNWAVGLGASLTYKSAYWHGVGFTLDGYTSQNPWHMDKEDIKFLKAGKDTLSRYDVYNDGDYHMNVLAQAYLELKALRSSLKLGRQKFESFLTKSNDTKMIPNTFEGVTLSSRYFEATTLKLAWLDKQKLRDHTRFHDPLTFKSSDVYSDDPLKKATASWANNDDAGVHRGLRYDYLEMAGEDTEHDLLVAEVWNRSLPNLKVMLNYTAVPEMFYDITAEAHYTLRAGSFKIIPGIRYMAQFDDGGGKVGGASLTGLLSPYADTGNQRGGYRDPRSLDGWLTALRIDLRSDAPWKARLGYSHIGDEADIIAPWRGFPTGGFTRAMGQYNWTANTDTWMIRGDYDFGRAGLVKGLKAMFRLAWEDYDQGKYVVIDGVKRALQLSDRRALHLDAIYKVPAVSGLEVRVRMAFVDADDNFDGRDPSYSEYRFEMNYLF